MRYLLFIIVVASTYFVEWIPNNTPASSSGATEVSSKGAWPWQL